MLEITGELKHNILIFLLVMAFFTGATIQFSEGSELIGVVMFLIALALTTKIRLSGAYITKFTFLIITLYSCLLLPLLMSSQIWTYM